MGDDVEEAVPELEWKGEFRPRALKPWSLLFCACLPLALMLSFLWYWQFALIAMVLCGVPTLRLFLWWKKNEDFAGPLDHVVSSFAQGFVVIFAAANASAAVGWLVTWLFLEFFFRIISAGAYDGGGPLGLLIMGCAWSTWVTIEEMWKVSFARWQKQRRAHVVRDPRETKAWISAATATAFGYATSQSVLFACLFAALLGADNKITWTEFGWLAVFAVAFGALSMPLTILTSYLIGLELTRDSPPATAIKWPVGLRVSYVFQFFLWYAAFRPVSGWLTLLFSLLSITAVYYATVKRIAFVEHQLPFDFLQNVAPLRRDLGFSLLPSGDDDPREQQLGLNGSSSSSSAKENADDTARTELVTVHTNPLPVMGGGLAPRSSRNDQDDAKEHDCLTDNETFDKPKDAVEL
mmetsp:Transcript_9482/g.30973  ORF Transcript_9482/g.30973 Transcript_9482/m.30973 type:complete len:408 (+) Transcript_9482:100-1323(+)|eukprot:CAMPEP_0118889744 /NCGR_PEP_ID=MMETSP1166-20130328/520_1 /TAXON_ID=1104430 /ORGANISM="Chrysoreinhardia sp, Strain CCMP3193" /LENGTH=407 /DNA_ID=CAMNT_0006828339 /DNA_START=57 /DNA_END=1280 /DNA_ORIENTATION=+